MLWENDYLEAQHRTSRKRTHQWRARHKRAIKKLHSKSAEWNMLVAEAKPRFGQCKALIKRFGGLIPFAIAVGEIPEVILFEWLMVEPRVNPKTGRRSGGWAHASHTRRTEGLLPIQDLARVMAVARHWGVLLRPQDIYPEFVGDDGIKNISANQEIMAWIKQIEPKARMREFEDTIVSLVSTPE